MLHSSDTNCILEYLFIVVVTATATGCIDDHLYRWLLFLIIWYYTRRHMSGRGTAFSFKLPPSQAASGVRTEGQCTSSVSMPCYLVLKSLCTTALGRSEGRSGHGGNYTLPSNIHTDKFLAFNTDYYGVWQEPFRIHSVSWPALNAQFQSEYMECHWQEGEKRHWLFNMQLCIGLHIYSHHLQNGFPFWERAVGCKAHEIRRSQNQNEKGDCSLI